MSPQTRTPPLQIREYLTYILPRLSVDQAIPRWPADVFALCMSLLQKSGAYVQALSQWPPHRADGTSYDSPAWTAFARDIGRQWRTAWTENQPLPARVEELWAQLLGVWNQPMRDCLRAHDRTGLRAALLELAVVADSASEGVGVAGFNGELDSEQLFYNEAAKLLEPDCNGSSLCYEIEKTRTRVLPKMHTPQNGLTIRSLSMHLALCCGDEITPCWRLSGTWPSPTESSSTGAPVTRSSLNLLLVPWPQYIRPAQFARSERLAIDAENIPDQHNLFTYRPPSAALPDGEMANRMRTLLQSAEDLMGKGRIDAVVMPELSLTQQMYEEVSPVVLKKKAAFIAGVVGDAAPNGHAGNHVLCDVPGLKQLQQAKHHRWCLDRSQIEQYGIGSQLYPEKLWWEHIDLQQRSITFLSLMPWLVLSVLICEDLARPDPAGDLIRAVGPNLVIALLMDGPQIKERWSARYATTLADDPGSSVLTLTSVGMSLLSRPSSGPSRGRTVALWKDAKRSAPAEIELPDGYDAVILSLTARWFEEFTADGRSDGRSAGHPVLSGVHPIKVNSQALGAGIY